MPTNPLLSLSSANLKKAAALQARIEQLQAKLAGLFGPGEAVTAAAKLTPAPRRSVSPARRKKLSLIAKARWKKVKAAGKTKL